MRKLPVSFVTTSWQFAYVKYALFLVGGFSVVSFLSISTVRASCEACYQTPEEPALYFEVMNTLIDQVEAIEAEPEPDDRPAFITDITNAAKILSNSLQNEILTTKDQYNNTFGGFLSLNDSRSFKRDMDKLTEIDNRIRLVTQSIVKKNIHNVDMKTSFLTDANDELSKLKFISLQRNKGGDFNLDVKNHREYVKLLRQINRFYKILYQNEFFAAQLENLGKDTNKSSNVDSDTNVLQIDKEFTQILQTLLAEQIKNLFIEPFDDLKDQESENTRYVEIDIKKLSVQVYVIQESYACATGKKNECEDGTKEIREKSGNLYKERVMNDAAKSWETIRDATIRLGGAFGIGSDEAKAKAQERKQALLQSQRGRDVGETGLFDGSTLRGTLMGVAGIFEELGTGFWETTSPLRKGAKKATQAYINHKNNKQAQNANEEKNAYDALEAKEALMETTYNELQEKPTIRQDQVFLSADKEKVSARFNSTFQRLNNAVDDVQYSNTRFMTGRSNELAQVVHASASLLLESNDALSEKCEQQCGNINGKICKQEN